MSDDRGYGTGRDGTGTGHAAELSEVLRTLADEHQCAPPVSGAEIRRLAVRRGRRRRTTVVLAGVAAAAAVAVTLTAGHGPGHDSGPGRRTTPATGPSLRPGPVPSATPTEAAADAVVDLTRRVMTVDGRVLPVSPGVPGQPAPTGRFTVTGKYRAGAPEAGSGLGGSGSGSGSSGGGAAKPMAPWGIELLSADTRKATFAIVPTHDSQAPGHHPATDGWIGLREADAKWLYARLDKGAVVLVTGRTPTVGASAPAPS
ncbi:L,D-transpeptidase [Streptomyces sp. NPDC001135]